MITIDDPEDGDTIRFYNPDTNLFLDVPFQLAKEQILTFKGLTELTTPEVLVGIVDPGSGLSGIICDEQADIPHNCFSAFMAGNNNNVYVS